MTKGPGRGTAGPPPGRKRGPGGSAGRDDKSGPGAARASGRQTGNPPRPSGGRADAAGRPGKKGGPAARRPSRGGTVPQPRKGTGKKDAEKKPAAKGTPAKAASAKKATTKKPTTKNAASAKSRTAAFRTTAATARPGGPSRTGGTRRDGPGGPRPGGGSGRRPPRPPRRPRVPFHRRDPMKRLNAGLLVVAFVLSLFAGRLVQLQTIESGKYSDQAMAQRVRDLKLPALRGAITDAQGRPLAMTVEARAITADPYVIKPDKRQAIVDALAPTLGLSKDAVMKAISRKGTQFVNLAHGVTPDQARLIMSWNFQGIGTLPEYRREYPNGSLGASVIGFVNGAGKGAAGLESTQNAVLSGRDGWQRVEISLEGQHIPMGEDQKKPPVPGRGIRLTLQEDLQYKAQQEIEKQVKASGARSGTVVVMDPRTGALLAMASAPGYDPNHVTQDDRDLWGSPLVQEAYEPGSTGKVVTAAAVMEHGGITKDTPFEVPYEFRKYDRVFHDAERHGVEHLTFAGVLAKSSNVGTILASQHISEEQLYQTLRDFGFGQPTGLPLPGETPGLLKPPSKWSGTDRYPIAFGQTVSVNAVQMASVYATIANGGVRVAPNLVAGTVEPNGKFAPAPAPQRRQVVSQGTARQISDMLEGVTTPDGTAPKAQIKGYRVAGKTGTAQRFDAGCGCYKGYTASFAGFAPADDPRLVVQVVLQDPKRGSHYGGDVAAPVFRDVMSFALQSEKIPPTGSKPPIIKIYARD
ncbi:peptidoglycan D,D-transpeptidase FtsI family protein [Actinomadura verrucosospora]|uniref:Peptidoglycan glycosyltransferase n=1 Tax=Actinomadura verrucosospora TaxID=46165 RepID=A0A7D4ABZ4_ACTVE|nr:penicillin-binding protein 2 [Actinomadura verrucosospora]QKG26647.1 peptidoglycan glycosyltransferase [Actinomadura verrucosospora]